MIFAGIAASPVSVMKRRLTRSAMISRMRGPRTGRATVAGLSSIAGSRAIARIDTSDITADTPKERR